MKVRDPSGAAAPVPLAPSKAHDVVERGRSYRRGDERRGADAPQRTKLFAINCNSQMPARAPTDVGVAHRGLRSS